MGDGVAWMFLLLSALALAAEDTRGLVQLADAPRLALQDVWKGFRFQFAIWAKVGILVGGSLSIVDLSLGPVPS